MSRTCAEAINAALAREMERDERIILIGEDIAGGKDAWGGPFGVTKGLYARFGKDRVMDMPISEAAFLTMAAGAAAAGLRPVVEIMFADFMGVCFDGLLNQVAKYRWVTGGRPLPLVIRTAAGAGIRAGMHHSQMLHGMLAQIPGLRVGLPATGAGAAGLLMSALRGDSPAVIMEHKALYDRAEEDCQDSPVPWGRGRRVHRGHDMTIIALSAMVHRAEEAARALAQKGLTADVMDPVSLAPLDEPRLLSSIRRTGRVLVVDEGPAHLGAGAALLGQLMARIGAPLKAPVRLLAGRNSPVPAAAAAEDAYAPSADMIEEAALALLKESV